MKNKKALAMSFVIILLVIMTIMVVMLVFSGRIREIYQNTLDKNICKSSVYSQHLASIKNIAMDSDIKCPMQRIEIREKEPEQIKKKMADLYANVCNEFGQGTLNLFGERETTFCVIRDKISFRHKDIIIEDFTKYLTETYMPNKDVTYAQYCSGFKTERGEEFFKGNINQLENAIIDTNKEYVIMFVYVKGEEEWREFAEFFGTSSKAQKGMYLGFGLMFAGYGLSATGAGSIIGLPLAYTGKVMLAGGSVLTGASALLNWFTNQDIKMEWVSSFVIREFDEEVLKELNPKCKYLPAEQHEGEKT